ncbi:FkbM family methyltransferase [bacterium]|nr:FkbM family methyltransferase [bacterium]
MAKEFDKQIKFRETEIDGVGNWMWPALDEGAWKGPSAEWENTHKDGYLEFCRGRDVVVQAGGNCGLYPRLFAKYFKRVYTFEPDALNFHCLVNNCQEENIIKLNAAIGCENKLVGINNGSRGNSGAFTVNEVGHIPTITIDQLGLDKCDLIQLDIEGYELYAIKGALKTIEKFKPVISMETVIHETDQILRNNGYVKAKEIVSDKIYRWVG